ncbi:hypothetical protein FQR65_LT11814 [Abscondita terminalis]|nr:hypothetical protein FQR65_LT11814 [Abscondita terminalis]
MQDREPADAENRIEDSPLDSPVNERDSSPQLGPSGLQQVTKTPEKQVFTSDITPGKVLDAVSPVPVVTPTMKKARRQISGVLSSHDCRKKHARTKKVPATSQQKKVPATPQLKKVATTRNKQSEKNKKIIESSSESKEEHSLDDSEDCEDLEDFENECVGCSEDYRKTKKKEDWIQCVICKRWLHEKAGKSVATDESDENEEIIPILEELFDEHEYANSDIADEVDYLLFDSKKIAPGTLILLKVFSENKNSTNDRYGAKVNRQVKKFLEDVCRPSIRAGFVEKEQFILLSTFHQLVCAAFLRTSIGRQHKPAAETSTIE